VTTQVDPAVLRRVRRFRVTRDLVVVAVGIALLVIGIVAGGSGTVWGVSIAMIVGFSAAAWFHARLRSSDRALSRRTHAIVAAIGLALGGYVVATGISAYGGIGQNATGVADYCVYVPQQRHRTGNTDQSTPAHNSCSVNATWPDGSTSLVNVDLPTDRTDGTTVAVHRPPAALAWLIPSGTQAPATEALALVAAGGLVVLQALAGLTLLAGRALKPGAQR
jgi:hypothetical protein